MLLAGGGVAAAAVGSRTLRGNQAGGAGNVSVSASRSAGGAGSTSAATTGSASRGATGSSTPGGASSGAGTNTSATATQSASPTTPTSGSPAGNASSSAPGSTDAASTHASGSPSSPSNVATKPQFYVDDQGAMAIALTLDDGPNPVYTPQVLEILDKYGVKATFNMIGQQVGANLSLVREVSAAGHTITNHTWDHADLSKYTYTQVLSQMDRCNDALANANQHPTIFRAPYGNWSKSVFQACAARDLKPVDSSVDPRDWDTEHVDSQQIVQTVLRHTHAHDIILEHDGGGNRRNTVAALKVFIPELIDRGFRFVAM